MEDNLDFAVGFAIILIPSTILFLFFLFGCAPAPADLIGNLRCQVDITLPDKNWRGETIKVDALIHDCKEGG